MLYEFNERFGSERTGTVASAARPSQSTLTPADLAPACASPRGGAERDARPEPRRDCSSRRRKPPSGHEPGGQGRGRHSVAAGRRMAAVAPDRLDRDAAGAYISDSKASPA
jgi:hypothetical protein